MHGGSDSGDLRNDVEGGIGTCATAARAKKWKWQRRELEWGTHVGGVDGVGGVVTEVIPDISHHGTAQFIIGVAERAAFSVTLLEEPTRVVVDVLHEPAAELTPLGVPNLRADARDPAPPYQREVTGVRPLVHTT